MGYELVQQIAETKTKIREMLRAEEFDINALNNEFNALENLISFIPEDDIERRQNEKEELGNLSVEIAFQKEFREGLSQLTEPSPTAPINDQPPTIIPPKPDKIDPNDIKNESKGMLLTDEQIHKVKQRLDSKEQYRRGELRQNQEQIFAPGERGFAVMRTQDKNGVSNDYVLYKGKGESGEDFTLGQGAFGRVKYAQNLDNGSWEAVKIQLVWRHNSLADINQENENLAKVGMGKGSVQRPKTLKGNENILKAADLLTSPRSNGDIQKGYDLLRQEAQAGNRLAKMILKLADSNLLVDAEVLLLQALENNGNVVMTQVVSVVSFIPGKTIESVLENAEQNFSHTELAKNTLQAYKDQLQANDLVHRDIKPANIMFDEKTGKVTFIDLGMARDKNTVQPRGGGTPQYMAPERLLPPHVAANESTEVYELGRTLGEMLGFYELKNGVFVPSNLCMTRIPDATERNNLKQLVRDMISHSPPRPTVEQCLQQLGKIEFEKNINAALKELEKIETEIVSTNGIDKNKEARHAELMNIIQTNVTDSPYMSEVEKHQCLKRVSDSEENVSLQKRKLQETPKFEEPESQEIHSSLDEPGNQETHSNVEKLEINSSQAANNKVTDPGNLFGQLRAIQRDILIGKKVSPEQVQQHTNLVKILREEIKNNDGITPAEKVSYYKHLSDSTELVAQKVQDTLHSRSVLTQVKDFAKEHLLEKKSTRQKLEEARAKHLQGKSDLNTAATEAKEQAKEDYQTRRMGK